MAITGGSFEFEETVTTGDAQHQEHRVAHAMVLFDDPKDMDAAVTLAMQKVRSSLGVVITPPQQSIARTEAAKKKTLPQIVTEVKAGIDADPDQLPLFPESDEIPGPRFYSDVELLAACKDKQAAGVGGVVIRSLINQYVGPGKSIIHLDSNGSDREKFMAALRAL